MYEVKIVWSDGNKYNARTDLSLTLHSVQDALEFVAAEQALVGKHPDYPCDVTMEQVHIYKDMPR